MLTCCAWSTEALGPSKWFWCRGGGLHMLLVYTEVGACEVLSILGLKPARYVLRPQSSRRLFFP